MTPAHRLQLYRIDVTCKPQVTLKQIDEIIIEAQRRFYLVDPKLLAVVFEPSAMRPGHGRFSLRMSTSSRSEEIANIAAQQFEQTFEHMERVIGKKSGFTFTLVVSGII